VRAATCLGQGLQMIAGIVKGAVDHAANERQLADRLPLDLIETGHAFASETNSQPSSTSSVLVTWWLSSSWTGLAAAPATFSISSTRSNRRAQASGSWSPQSAIDTGGPMGRMVLTVLGMVAEMEHGFILDRQRAGIEAAKAKGIYKGRPVTLDPY
jgi:Resolvase, N terminal domain